YIGLVGTRRSWRGRGLASALVAHALAAMKGAGYGRALLTADTANPVHGLYERLGFVTERRHVTYQRPIMRRAGHRGRRPGSTSRGEQAAECADRREGHGGADRAGAPTHAVRRSRGGPRGEQTRGAPGSRGAQVTGAGRRGELVMR